MDITLVSTDDELPPEHTEILWWCDDGEGWRLGGFWLTWFLCRNGPAWWARMPANPTLQEVDE